MNKAPHLLASDRLEVLQPLSVEELGHVQFFHLAKPKKHTLNLVVGDHLIPKKEEFGEFTLPCAKAGHRVCARGPSSCK